MSISIDMSDGVSFGTPPATTFGLLYALEFPLRGSLLASLRRIDWLNPKGVIYPQDGHQNVLVATNDPVIFDSVREALE